MAAIIETAKTAAAGILPSKPILMYGHAAGPNPWKVAMVMEELNIPYEVKHLDFATVKGPEFLAINPNGRVPGIVDPNTGYKLWESGAIIEYLIDTYDKTGKFSYKTGENYYQQKVWLHFQMSGQGPYFGQAAWFTRYHPEKVPSALERYQKEIKRIISVIELHLSRTGQEYLVGDMCTYADTAFVPWDTAIAWLVGGEEENAKLMAENPNFAKWHARVTARPAVQKIIEARAAAIAAMNN